MRHPHRWFQARAGAVDLLLAGIVAGLALLDTAMALRWGRSGPWGPWDVRPPAAVWLPLGFALTMLGALAMAVRSRRIIGAGYGTAALGAAVLVVLPFPATSLSLAMLVMVYSVAARAPRRHDWVMLGIAVAGGPVAALRATGPVMHLLHGYLDVDRGAGSPDWWIAYLVTALLLDAVLTIAWLAGQVVRTRRSYLRAMVDRVTRLEREREALNEASAARERARIARELHDIVAHSLSVVVLQADGAANVLGTDPDRARAALAEIGRTSRRALTEMRRLLGVLRVDRDPAPGGGAGLVPQPGLPAIGDLVARLRSAGLPVVFEDHLDGAALAGLPAGIGLSAYRIVQEALTNVLRHAANHATATVSLRVDPAGLIVEVTDDGSGGDAAGGERGGGHGLIGIRERAAAVGGSVAIGPRPGGGFEVRAVLPYQVEEAE